MDRLVVGKFSVTLGFKQPMCDELSSVNGPMKVHCLYHWWNECGTIISGFGLLPQRQKNFRIPSLLGHTQRGVKSL